MGELEGPTPPPPEIMRIETFDPESLRQTYSAMPSDELLAIVTIDAHQCTDEAVKLARAELHARGFSDSELLERVRGLQARLPDTAEESRAKKLLLWLFWPFWIFW